MKKMAKRDRVQRPRIRGRRTGQPVRGTDRLAVEVRFALGLKDRITAELSRSVVKGLERVAFGLIGGFEAADRYVVCVPDMISVPDDAYRTTAAGTAWTSSEMARVASVGLARGLGLMIMHSHGFSREPRLSLTDESGFRTLEIRLRRLLPSLPHGSIVIGEGDAVGGLISLPGPPRRPFSRVVSTRWTDDPMVIVPPRSPPHEPSLQVYDRQAILIGQAGQRLLAGTRVGVVGLGGGGSHVVQQLAHAGFGSLVLVDDDRVEPSNLSRLVGASGADVARPKTDVMGSLVERINPECQLTTIAERFPSERGITALREVDVIVSCVDTLTSRVELQKFGWRYLVPIVDIGIGTRLADDQPPARTAAVAGHIHVYLPGGPCMWCTGLLSEEKLAAESGGRGPEYVAGAANPAQVVSFNGSVASIALTELMQLFTGFMVRDRRDVFLSYDAINERLYDLKVDRTHPCKHSRSELGMGTPSEYSVSG